MKFFSRNNLKTFRTGDRAGSALILTMFILAGMMVVAFSGAYIVLLGVKAADVQAQSGKAYFVAEAGDERLLWELRQNGWIYSTPSASVIFSDTFSDTGATYSVYFTNFPPLIFSSVGDYRNTKRSVELRI